MREQEFYGPAGGALDPVTVTVRVLSGPGLRAFPSVELSTTSGTSIHNVGTAESFRALAADLIRAADRADAINKGKEGTSA